MVQNLFLTEPALDLKVEYLDFYQEWLVSEERMIPGVIEKDPSNFEQMIKILSDSEKGLNLPEKLVPESIFWLINGEKKVLGVVSIRHRLNDSLLNTGGHIGYGIRPTERQRGFATKLLSLALEKAKELNIEQVLLVCEEKNTGSYKTIIKNGGVPDSDYIIEDGTVMKRFWISLS